MTAPSCMTGLRLTFDGLACRLDNTCASCAATHCCCSQQLNLTWVLHCSLLPHDSPLVPYDMSEAEIAWPGMQALQYLRKLCSHPLLVLDPATPAHVEAVEKATHLPATSATAWKAAQPHLHHLQHAPKLLALKQLLQVPPCSNCMRSPNCWRSNSFCRADVASLRT